MYAEPDFHDSEKAGGFITDVLSMRAFARFFGAQ